MKTTKFASAISTLGLVLFMSLTSIANNSKINTGDLTKSANKYLAAAVAPETDYSYLRFDVNKYMRGNEEVGDIENRSWDYLRFDVNNFATENVTDEMELPMADEFDYLRFNLADFTKSTPVEVYDLPLNEFDYLHFDVNNFYTPDNDAISVLPLTI